jgi:hypothetical protein
MRAAHLVALLGTLAAGGCMDSSDAYRAPQYQIAQPLAPLALSFLPGSGEPDAASRAVLRQVRPTLPATSLPVLHAGGPWAVARVRSVSAVLGHPVLLAPEQDNGSALLTFSAQTAIVSDGCLGPGTQDGGDLWPGDDARRPVRLPPGCSTEQILQAQVTSRRDLLVGQNLGPAASSPYAGAIERYYNRNAAPPAKQSKQSDTEASSSTESTAANPLLGGVTKQ